MQQTVRYPLVSVVTVNYNQSGATCDMLESLYASGYPDLEVFVVDNASPSDHPEIIKKKFPQVVFIQSEKNLGFAGGNNLALRQAKGEYIYLLNNDTIVPENHIQNLVQALENSPKWGVVCPKIKLFDDPNILMFAGYTELTPYTLRNKTIGLGEQDNGQYDKPAESAYAHGAAMMLKREVIEKVGVMNEQYFLYYEEVDWSTRIRKAGYLIGYAPETYMLHKESLATGRNSPLKSYYLNRNRALYLLLNVSGQRKFIGLLYQMAIAMPKNMLLCAIHGQFSNMRAVMRAWGWCLIHCLK
ncbi:glycosyl transferase [Bacteroidia bacterium]|nr:glycosyl transferase [Bacteroidia bacterium]